ncbi:MAG: DinB family protein [Terriglobia bacterium]
MLARYNRTANERLFEQCAHLDIVEYRKQRQGSFGSIHGLLNHILLSDQIWMARFKGDGHTTPVLNTVLYDDFSGLRPARIEQDARIEAFFERLEAEFLSKVLRYANSQGKECLESAPVAVSHFFNHQTHHRGQIHVMLSQTQVRPPSLDLHRIINP